MEAQWKLYRICLADSPVLASLSVRRLVPAAFFLALSLAYTHPLATRMGSTSIDLGPDTRLFLWTLAWDAHALRTAPLSIFDANIFHPEPRTLAYSEHQIGSAVLAAPLIWGTGNLVLAMNAVLVLSCFLSGWFAYLLARGLGLSKTSSFLAGAVFALTPPRFFRIGQLHLATVEWIPLCLALLHRYARGGRTRHLLGAVLAFWLQALSGGQSGVFLAYAAAGLLAYLSIFGELRPASGIGKDALVASALALALNLPFLLPYLRVRSDLGLERSLDEAIFWSPDALSFLASPTHLHQWLGSAMGLGDAKAHLFPGFVPILLALFAFARATKSARTPPASRARPGPTRSVVLDCAIAVTLLAAVLVEALGGIRLGPVSASDGARAALLALVLAALRFLFFGRTPSALLSWWRGMVDGARRFLEPRTGIAGGFYAILAVLSLWASLGPQAFLYSALYRLVPGFDFIRVPSRITLLSALALAVLAGIGAERLRRYFPALVVALLVELAAFPLVARPYEIEISPMDRALASMDPGPVAVFPVPDPRDTIAAASRHSQYMLHSTAHFLPLLNGYSGFTPERHDRIFRELASFPSEKGVEELEALGVRYLVLHRRGYGGEEWDSVLDRIARYSERLALREKFEEGRIYEVTRGR
jgi:hypothetical protein